MVLKISADHKMLAPEGAGAGKPESDDRSGMVMVVAPFWKELVAITRISVDAVRVEFAQSISAISAVGPPLKPE